MIHHGWLEHLELFYLMVNYKLDLKMPEYLAISRLHIKYMTAKTIIATGITPPEGQTLA